MKRLVQSVLYALQGLDVNAMNLIKRDALRSTYHAQHLGDRLFRNGNALAVELCCERRYRNALARASLGNMLAQAHFVNVWVESFEEGGYRSGRSRFRVQERVLRGGGVSALARGWCETAAVRLHGSHSTHSSLPFQGDAGGEGGEGRGVAKMGCKAHASPLSRSPPPVVVVYRDRHLRASAGRVSA